DRAMAIVRVLAVIAQACLVLPAFPASGDPPAVAQAKPAAPAQAGSDAAGDEEDGKGSTDQPERTPQGGPLPEGREIIHVRGHAVTGIQTDVPSSVTTFDEAALQALGAQSVADLAKVTPNVEIKTAGATQATFFIRGVGLSDFSANAAGAVAIF